VCECDEGYDGPDCSNVKATCPADCSGHGVCQGSSCKCNFGFSGSDCSEAFSPCNGCQHGTCTESIDDIKPHCACDNGFTGPHCTVYDHSSDPCRNTSFCSAHGKCSATDTTCVCDGGFGGENCGVVVQNGCVNACGGHGRCDPETDTCKCDHGWSGSDCMTPRCPSTAGAMCSGHGACTSSQPGDDATMACVCQIGFFGTSCYNAYCTNSTCSGHGSCRKSSGVWDSLCNCDNGWSGALCDTNTAKTSFVSKGKAKSVKQSPNSREELSESVDDFLDTAP